MFLYASLVGEKKGTELLSLNSKYLHVIVKATLADADELSALINSAYRGETSRKGWTTEADLLDGGRTDAAALREIILETGHTLLKYVESSKIIGCVELRQEGNRICLGMLTVSPDLQGKGIGKKLLAAAEAEAKNLRCSAIYMTVISVRKELIDWYARHGYRKTGERKPFDFNDPRFGLPRQELEFIVLEKPMQPPL